MKQIHIFDTTLRDGQQCPGAGMSYEANLTYAQMAAETNIDVLEAGFPSASDEDFRMVNDIAEALKGSRTRVAALAQLKPQQTERTMEALTPLLSTGQARVHLYLPVAPALMTASLGRLAKQHDALIDTTAALIAMASDAGFEVQFSPEAYSQMGENFDFVSDLLLAAVESGARIINCPDTIGRASPWQGEDYFVHHMNQHAKWLKRQLPNHPVTWSVHCHNDFGLAVSNSLNAVEHGPATQIEGCFNGIGERAGNAALEQCIMALQTFGPAIGLNTQAQTGGLVQLSDFVAEHMLPRQPHWPITGENAAKHSSGGHTNAILKNPHIYQPFPPESVGQKISFLFGPLSGSNHAQSIINHHGYICHDDEKYELTQSLKNTFKNRRKGVSDKELMAAYIQYRAPFHSLRFQKSNGQMWVHLTHNKEPIQCNVSDDDGTTALAAMQSFLIQHIGSFKVQQYQSESIGQGIHASAKASIQIEADGRVHAGLGHDQDIIVAAIKALINACNQWQVKRDYSLDQTMTQQQKHKATP